MSLKRPSKEQPENFEFNSASQEAAKTIVAKYPEGKQQSAVMALLYIEQKQNSNWIPLAAMKYIGKFLEMPYIEDENRFWNRTANWFSASFHVLGVIAGEVAPLFDDLAQAHVQAFDGVGGVDDFADRLRVGQERDDLLPISSPRLTDGRQPVAPFSLEFIEPQHRRIGAFGPVDRFEVSGYGLAFLPTHITQAVADHMHDTGLHEGLREHRVDGLGKALQAVNHGDEDIVDAPVLDRHVILLLQRKLHHGRLHS